MEVPQDRKSPVNSAARSTSNLVDESRVSYKTQYLAALLACLGPIAMGTVLGYSSPAFPDMNKPGRRFSISDDEQSLAGSLMTLGALAGGLVAGVLVDYFGRKFCAILIAIPFTAGWLLIIYAESVIPLYIGRVITGICCGIVSLNIPVYISEIASPGVRGMLGSAFQLSVVTGVLITYCVGSQLVWSWTAVFGSVFPILLMIAMTFMPETPVWLISKGQKEQALASLEWLRGEKADVQAELDDLVRAKQEEGNKMSFKDFLKPTLLKPLLIALAEMLFQQLSGVNAIIFNSNTIFEGATKAFPAYVASIIVAAVMVISTVVAVILMDRAGRRLLLLISSAIMTLSMVAMGFYYYLNDVKHVENISMLPVIALVVFVSSFSIGYGPIPWLMMGEMFPSQARGLASSMATALNWLMAFVVTKTFLDLTVALGSDVVFWLYGGICGLSTVFVFFFVPETKGKTIEDITAYFGGNRPI